MSIISVKYQDSYIFTSLKVSQDAKTLLKNIRSIYVNYKLKSSNKEVRDTSLVKRDQVIPINNNLILKVELQDIYNIEDCFIEIISIKFNLKDGMKLVFPVKQLFSFLDIERSDLMESKKEIDIKWQSSDRIKNEDPKLEDSQLEQIKPQEKSIKSPLQTKKVDNSNVGVILKDMETEIENQLNKELEQIDMDINRMFYSVLNLMIANLPQPKSEDEFQFTRTMTQSIQKYIEIDLIRKEEEYKKENGDE